jgi:hypothetical protein
MEQEVLVTSFKALSRHFPGRTEASHENLKLGSPVCEPRIETGASRKQNRNDFQSACLNWRSCFVLVLRKSFVGGGFSYELTNDAALHVNSADLV